VNPDAFRQALPWFRWRELTVFANHFGQRDAVVQEVSAELAGEIGRRLSSASAAAAALPSERSVSAAEVLPGASSREVAAIVYSFSKLRPQLPEYAPVYNAVAEGIRCQTWEFSRLQAALVGTALADAQVHTSDALPAVVRVALGQLARDAGVRAELTFDELRYLVHACAHVQSPGLDADEVRLLAECTQRLVAESREFSKLAHLMVSWLALPAPSAAKEVHQKALSATCVRLHELEPRGSAHPLPLEGLAPVVANLLARESRQEQPPLTPPKFKEIVGALVLISQGLRGPAAARTQSLGFSDWMQIAPLVINFCKSHSSAPSSEPRAVGASQELPGWAARMLGHVIVRARVESAHGGPPLDLSSLMSLMHLLRRHKPMPAPDDRFYAWAARQAAAHSEVSGVDRELLAALVGELVPRIPQNERSGLAKILLSGTREPKTNAASEVSSQAAQARRLLPAHARVPQWKEVDVTLAGSTTSARVSAAMRNSSRVVAKSGGDLWTLLDRQVVSVQSEHVAEVRSQVQLATVVVVAGPVVDEDRLAAVSAVSPLVATAEQAAEPSALTQVMKVIQAPVTPVPAEGAAEMRDMMAKFELAMKRVEVLETRLEEQKQNMQRVEAENKKSSSSASSSSTAKCSEEEGNTAPFEEPDVPKLRREPGAFGGWPAGALLGGGLAPSVVASTPTSPHMAMLHLHQPFNFEQFRRANSPRAQAERLRVVMPPDHIPFWPLWRKP